MQEMENLWQSRVDRKMSYLQDNCKVTEKLLWALLGEQLITYHEKQEIEVKKTDLRKLNCLIEITRFKGPDSYQKFCDALDTAGQTFVVDELTGRSTFVSARSFGTGFSSEGRVNNKVFQHSRQGNPVTCPTGSSSNDQMTATGLSFINKDVDVATHHHIVGGLNDSIQQHQLTPTQHFNVPSTAAPFLPPVADEKWELVHTSPTSPEIHKIAMRLGRRWNSLIPFMEPNSDDLEIEARIIADRRDKLEPEKAELYLLLWKEKFNDKATRYCLVNVLIDCSQRLTADQVFGRDLVELVQQVRRLGVKTE